MLLIGVLVLSGLSGKHGGYELAKNNLSRKLCYVEVVYGEDVVGKLNTVKLDLLAVGVGLGLFGSVGITKCLVGSVLNLNRRVRSLVYDPVNLNVGVLNLRNGLAGNCEGIVLNGKSLRGVNSGAYKLAKEGLGLCSSIRGISGEAANNAVRNSLAVEALSVYVLCIKACGKIVLTGLCIEIGSSVEAVGVADESSVILLNLCGLLVIRDALNLDVGVGVLGGNATLFNSNGSGGNHVANLCANKNCAKRIGSVSNGVKLVHNDSSVLLAFLSLEVGDRYNVTLCYLSNSGGAVDVRVDIVDLESLIVDKLVKIRKSGETKLEVGRAGSVHLACVEGVGLAINLSGCKIAEVERIVVSELAGVLLIGSIGNLENRLCNRILNLNLSAFLIYTEISVGDLESVNGKSVEERGCVECCVLAHIVLGVAVCAAGKGEESHSNNKN